MSRSSRTDFSEDYYGVCTSNNNKKDNQWFCNRNLDPLVLLTPLKPDKCKKKSHNMTYEIEENNLSPQEINKKETEKFAHNISEKEDTPTIDEESPLYDSDADPEYNPYKNKTKNRFQQIFASQELPIIEEESSDSFDSNKKKAKHHFSKKKSFTSDEESVVYESDVSPECNSFSSNLDEQLSENDSIDVEIPLQNNIIQSFSDPEESNKECSKTGGSDISKRQRHTNFCCFCENSVTNFARHITRNHSFELEVQKMLSLPVKSKERKDLLSFIRKKGNYLMNSEKGKPMRSNKCSTYLPCTFCLGFYSSKNLWRHRKICSSNPNFGASTSTSRSEAHNLLTRHLKIDPQLRDKVFPRMRADKISLCAKKDILICAFATRYLKIHREQHLVHVASRKMRELAKILLEVQNIEPKIKNLFEALNPVHYEHLVTATKIVARFDPEKEMYLSPTFAINMGTSLKQCCEIALKFALKKSEAYASVSSAQAETDLRTEIQLIEGHWRFDISSIACNDLNSKKWNKVTIVPLASDLKKLKEYLIEKANVAISELQINNKNREAYSDLIETIFCRVILLNRKRPGELQRFLLHTYVSSLNNSSKTYEEFSEVVSETEKALMKNFKRIVIRGKRGRGVPVLFTKDVQKHLEIALQYRNEILTTKNNYLFPNLNTDQPILGYRILKKYAEACGAKNPSAITCTRLRKHLATLTQLFNMSDNDMEQLASFMGHTLGVHRSSYRLPDDIYQTAKISKLLLLMEDRAAGNYKGKKLDEININMEDNLLNDKTKPIEELNEFLEASSENVEENIEVECSSSSVSVPKNKNSNQQKKRILIPWTEKQKQVVTSYFKDHIKKKYLQKKGKLNI